MHEERTLAERLEALGLRQFSPRDADKLQALGLEPLTAAELKPSGLSRRPSSWWTAWPSTYSPP